MLTPGALFAHYRVERILGEGGMGTVYRALDTRLERVVALKLIRASLAESAGYRAKLSDEARKAAKVDSPYVVKVWEHDVVDNVPYIAYEFVDGRDLRVAASDLTFEQKLQVVTQVALGLGVAHEQGLVHQDLKPENVLIWGDKQAKILDFGLARTTRADSVDAMGNIEGTLHYLSPEQITGEALGVGADVFAFGVLLYELFCGVRPFDGAYPASVIYAILHESPKPPRDQNPDLPEWVEQLILKALAKRPEQRFLTMAEVLAALEHGRESGKTASADRVTRPRKSVTVLAFKSIPADEEWAHFCEGFTDDLINEIAHRTDLIISAEPSSSSSRDIRDVFRRVRSDFVITGSLMRLQGNVRLTLTVYGEQGDKISFGKTYSGTIDDLLTMMGQAARDVGTSLAEIVGFTLHDTDDFLKTSVSAYEYYVRGKGYYQTIKPDDLKFAAEMFQRAIDIDPKLPLPYTGLSDVYATEYNRYYDRSPAKIALAREYAEKALALNPRLPEAHRSLGRYYMFTDNVAQAEASFLKAIELNPKFAIGYRTLAWLKEHQGDHDAAIHWAKRTLELAPTDLETLQLLSLINMDLRKPTVAMATLQRSIELGPDDGKAYYLLGLVYLKLGVPEFALENFLLAIKYKGDPNCYVDAGYVCMAQGNVREATKLFTAAIENGSFVFLAHYYLGRIAALEGNTEAAQQYYQKAAAECAEVEAGGDPERHVAAYRALVLAAMGKTTESAGLLAEIRPVAAHNGEVLHVVARAYGLLGDLAQTKHVMQEALAAHAGPTEKELKFDPHFAAMTD